MSRKEIDDARRGNTNMQLYGSNSPAGFGGTFGAYWHDGHSYNYTDMMLTGLVSTPSQSYEFTPSTTDGSNELKGFAAAYVLRQESDGTVVIPALSGGADGSPDDVVITLNPSAGTLTASVTTRELEHGGTWTSTQEHNLITTATDMSAYVSPKAFGVIGTSNGDDAGLVTATRQVDTSDNDAAAVRDFHYTSWGRWGRTEETIDGVASSIEPESLWVAGPLTPVSTLNALATDGGYGKSGTYQGEVRGYRVENSVAAQVFGTTNLTANFNTRQLTGHFADITPIGSTTPWVTRANLDNVTWTSGANAIKGHLTNTAEGVTGTINGAFFGPNARELGGNWAIQKTDNSVGAGIHRSIQQTLTPNNGLTED